MNIHCDRREFNTLVKGIIRRFAQDAVRIDEVVLTDGGFVVRGGYGVFSAECPVDFRVSDDGRRLVIRFGELSADMASRCAIGAFGVMPRVLDAIREWTEPIDYLSLNRSTLWADIGGLMKDLGLGRRTKMLSLTVDETGLQLEF